MGPHHTAAAASHPAAAGTDGGVDTTVVAAAAMLDCGMIAAADGVVGVGVAAELSCRQ